MARRFSAPYQTEPVSALATWSRNLAVFAVIIVLVAVIIVHTDFLEIKPAMVTFFGGLAVAGLGVARLADFMVARALRDGALVRLLVDSHVPESFPIHALTVPGRHRAPRIRAFVDFLAKEFGRTG